MQQGKPYLGCSDLWKEAVQTHLYPLISHDDTRIDMDEEESVINEVLNEMDR